MNVRDVFYNVIGRPENETDDVCETLGIDPDMPVETLQRRLLWGERVESIKHPPTFGDDYEEGVTDGVKWTLRQIVAPDNTDSPVPPVIVPPSPSAAPGVVPVPRNTRQDGDDTETETADEGFWRRLATGEDFDPYGLER